MGTSIVYRSVEPIASGRKDEVAEFAETLVVNYVWVSCEPVSFYDECDDGRLVGSSKLVFDPSLEEIEALSTESLPDGTIADVLNVLSQISTRFKVDWEVSHDYDETPIGYIRNGQIDADLNRAIMAFSQIEGMISEVMDVDGGIELPDSREQECNDDDYEPPATIKFPG